MYLTASASLATHGWLSDRQFVVASFEDAAAMVTAGEPSRERESLEIAEDGASAVLLLQEIGERNYGPRRVTFVRQERAAFLLFGFAEGEVPGLPEILPGGYDTVRHGWASRYNVSMAQPGDVIDVVGDPFRVIKNDLSSGSLHQLGKCDFEAVRNTAEIEALYTSFETHADQRLWERYRLIGKRAEIEARIRAGEGRKVRDADDTPGRFRCRLPMPELRGSDVIVVCDDETGGLVTALPYGGRFDLTPQATPERRR